MSRKNRVAENQPTAPSQQGGEAPKDAFQEKGERVVVGATQLFEGKGTQIRNGLIVLVVIGVIIGVAYVWMGRSAAESQTALGKALEVMTAPIIEIPAPDATQLSFKTEAERDAAALKAFDEVASKHGGDVGEKAKYFAATLRLKTDRPAAIAVLTGLADASSATGELARFALAQALAADGKADEALEIYGRILSESQGVVPKEKVEFEIAALFEKQGKKDEAIAKYFDIAKKGLEAKAADGTPAPMTTSATKAKQRVEKLSPDKAKELAQAPIELSLP